MKVFKTPKLSLGGINAETVASLIATAADIALVVDGDGVIQDLVCQHAELAAALNGPHAFLGKLWVETVTTESRPKVETLLREAVSGEASGWREVHYPSARGEIPILYATVRTGRRGNCVAIGRDVQAVASLQQRLVDAQISMERDYSRLRHVEARYRILFQMSPEPVLMVDGASEKVVEANPAALQIFGYVTRNLIGRRLTEVFHRESATALQTLLSEARSAGHADAIKVRLKDGAQERHLSALLFRQENAALFLLRFGADARDALPLHKMRLLKCVEKAPDGFVVTDVQGRVVVANPAFLDMAQLASEERVRGALLERWVGRPGIDLNVFMTSLRQHGSVRLFATVLNGEQGTTVDIEISAATVEDDGELVFVFAIRNVERRLHPGLRESRQLPRSAEQVTELIGRVPLKDIVRETTDVIERLCIEAALKMTGDNRASAAEMLGLSRQSLYVKLRRFGLADPALDVDIDNR